MIRLHVPGMDSRHSVRVVSGWVCDVPGVQTVEVDLQTRTVRVTGPADPAAVAAAVAAAGFSVEGDDGARFTSAGETEETAMETFATDITGLPEAGRPQVLDVGDGESVDLRPRPVAKRVDGTTVRMLGYNGSIPGPTLRVRQGAEIVVHVTNDTELETTVHWHGLRLQNRYDGVPNGTQRPIAPGERFSYRLQFPDPGLYWYHPHVREDYTQEMGLYGSILVQPVDPDYWPPAHRDVVLTLDDLLVEDGGIAPFSRRDVTFAAMGRYGNLLLVGGEPDATLSARVGEVVRLWLTNTANVRVFDVGLPGARMKLVGGDSGRVEHEEFVRSLLIAPSERAVVDVLFDESGTFTLEHRTPDRTYRLASVTVTDDPVAPNLRAEFERLRAAPELAAERAGVERWLEAQPDKILAAVATMDHSPAPTGEAVTYACPMHPEVVSPQPGRCPKCGMTLVPAAAPAQPTRPMGHGPADHTGSESGMAEAGHRVGHGMAHHMSSDSGIATIGDGIHHEAAGHKSPAMAPHSTTSGGIEWEDGMVEMNRAMTPATMHWELLDRTGGSEGPPEGWAFTAGKRVKIRLVNEMDSDHPMQHPFHIHGGGRFLVLARDGVPEPNLVWKDTVLLRTGETVDLLLDVTNPGRWMAHCHIPEHMHSGMMFDFTVAPAASA